MPFINQNVKAIYDDIIRFKLLKNFELAGVVSTDDKGVDKEQDFISLFEDCNFVSLQEEIPYNIHGKGQMFTCSFNSVSRYVDLDTYKMFYNVGLSETLFRAVQTGGRDWRNFVINDDGEVLIDTGFIDPVTKRYVKIGEPLLFMSEISSYINFTISPFIVFFTTHIINSDFVYPDIDIFEESEYMCHGARNPPKVYDPFVPSNQVIDGSSNYLKFVFDQWQVQIDELQTSLNFENVF